MTPRTIIYSIPDTNNQKETAIIHICKQLDIRTKRLKQTDVNLTVGRLVGMSVPKAFSAPSNANEKAAPEFTLPELLIFHGLDDATLDLFLAKYKEQNLEPIALKAIVTPYNLSWTVYHLIRELIREHVSMHP